MKKKKKKKKKKNQKKFNELIFHNTLKSSFWSHFDPKISRQNFSPKIIQIIESLYATRSSSKKSDRLIFDKT